MKNLSCKQLLLLFLLLFLIEFLLVKSFSANQILFLQKDNASIADSLKYYIAQDEFQEENVGIKFNISSNLNSNSQRNTILKDKKFKIFIIDYPGSCQKCVFTYIDSFKRYILSSCLNKQLCLYILIPSVADIADLKNIYKNLGFNIIISHNLRISNYKVLLPNTSAIAYLDSSNVCMYCFFINGDSNKKIDVNLKILNKIIYNQHLNKFKYSKKNGNLDYNYKNFCNNDNFKIQEMKKFKLNLK